jgi:septum formation protein
VRLILASASPRRRELIAHLQVPFEVAVSGVDETVQAGESPDALARRLARAKAAEVAAAHSGAVVLAADTIVVLDGAVLNKPADADDARSMLSRLRDRDHVVITAVAVASNGEVRVEAPSSHVTMRPYGEREVEAWIAGGGPFDKAGAYAVQDPAFAPVARIDGCYCNVMGLPLWTTVRMLSEGGIEAQVGLLPDRCRDCPLR